MVIRREKRFAEHPLQLRITPNLARTLKRMAETTGVDRSTIARMALCSGLADLQKTLPRAPVEEPQA
jgi:hypothetical protein